MSHWNYLYGASSWAGCRLLLLSRFIDSSGNAWAQISNRLLADGKGALGGRLVGSVFVNLFRSKRMRCNRNSTLHSPKQPRPWLWLCQAGALLAAISLGACLPEPPPDASSVEHEQTVLTTRNLALGQPAWQSSTYGSNYPASKAVDNEVSGVIYLPFGSVPWITHTNNEYQPFWEVDIQSAQFVNQVVIYNRADCCADRLSNFDVKLSVDNQTWTTYYFPNTPPSPLTIDVDQPVRYVKVQLRGTNVLSLAEVQVLQTDRGRNLALRKVATQSSDYGPLYPARLAVDGNTDGSVGNGSVTHTNWESKPWWQVDLGAPTFIGDVVLYNRTDCCSERLSDFDVLASDDGSTWGTVSYSGTPTFPLRVPINRTARFVKVMLRGTGYLSLAEVQVLGDPSNLALGGVASASSALTSGGKTYGPNLAIDGNTDGNFANGSVTQSSGTDTNPYWMVDLGSPYAISNVVLFNRTDCCDNWLTNYTVRVWEDQRAIYTVNNQPGVRASDRGSYLPVNRIGRFVMIIQNLPNTPLSLAEVQVLGAKVPCAPGQTPNIKTVDIPGAGSTYGGRAIDSISCVTLTPWVVGTDLPPNSKVAIRQKRIAPAGNLAAPLISRWMGPDLAGIVSPQDGDLFSSNIFSVETYFPSTTGNYGFPWFNLRATNGDYVYAGMAADGTNTNANRFYGTRTQANALIFTQGVGGSWAGNLQTLSIISRASSTLNPWSDAASLYQQLTQGTSSVGNSCLRYREYSDSPAVYLPGPCAPPPSPPVSTSLADYFIVQ